MGSLFSLNDNKNNLIIACMVSAALIPLNTTMIAASLPDIGNYYQIKISYLTTSLVTSYLLINLLFSSVAGKMGDVYDRRCVLNLAHLVIAIGVLLSLLKSFFVCLVIARLLMALGGSFLVTNTIALICDEVTREKRVVYLGLQSSLFGFSLAFGPLLGGLITQYINWQSIFLVNIPPLVISFIFINKKLAVKSKHTNTKIIDNITEPPLISDIFRNTNFIIGNLVLFTQNVVFYGVLFSLPFVLRNAFNSSSFEIGKISFLMTISMALTAFAGGLIKSHEKQKIVLPSLIAITVFSLCAFYLALDNAYLPLLFTALCLIGCSIGFGYAPSQNLIMLVSDSTNRGLISGISSTIRYAGSIIGILIFTYVLNFGENILLKNKLCILIYICICIFSLITILYLNLRNANQYFLKTKMTH